MLFNRNRRAVLATACLVAAMSAPAASQSPKELMEISAGCAYVVGIAEGNNVPLNYGAADWMTIVQLIEERTDLDGDKALEKAKAKYEKRARVMGADEALNYMLERSRECDREMAVIQS